MSNSSGRANASPPRPCTTMLTRTTRRIPIYAVATGPHSHTRVLALLKSERCGDHHTSAHMTIFQRTPRLTPRLCTARRFRCATYNNNMKICIDERLLVHCKTAAILLNIYIFIHHNYESMKKQAAK